MLITNIKDEMPLLNNIQYHIVYIMILCPELVHETLYKASTHVLSHVPFGIIKNFFPNHVILGIMLHFESIGVTPKKIRKRLRS
jgi:hypothetical protein